MAAQITTPIAGVAAPVITFPTIVEHIRTGYPSDAQFMDRLIAAKYANKLQEFHLKLRELSLISSELDEYLKFSTSATTFRFNLALPTGRADVATNAYTTQIGVAAPAIGSGPSLDASRMVLGNTTESALLPTTVVPGVAGVGVPGVGVAGVAGVAGVGVPAVGVAGVPGTVLPGGVATNAYATGAVAVPTAATATTIPELSESIMYTGKRVDTTYTKMTDDPLEDVVIAACKNVITDHATKVVMKTNLNRLVQNHLDKNLHPLQKLFYETYPDMRDF